MMAEVASHKDKGVWIAGGASETSEMPNGVARCVETVKRAIAKEIIRLQCTDSQRSSWV